jgi:ribosomal protein S6
MTSASATISGPTVTASNTDGVRLYECMVLLPVNLPQKEDAALVKNIEELFAEKNGKQLYKNEWDRWGLAFAIKGHSEGRYIVYVYELPADAMQEIDASLHLEKNVLRHLLLRIPDGYELIDYPAQFRTWLEERDKEEAKQEKEKEEELKKKIVKRVAKKTVSPIVKKEDPATHEGGADLSEKLEELISDEDLNL